MLGDVLLIGEHHRRAAAALVAAVLGRLPVDGRLVVAISGESGSGKSELSHLLAKGLTAAGLPAKTIAGDNFFRIDPLERSAWRVERGVEARVGLGEVDWDAFDRCVADFRAGNTSTFPCIDLVPQRVDQLTTDFAPIRVLVVDGLYTVHLADADLRVFIDLTYHQTKRAQMLRGKEATDVLRWQVLEAEHRAVQALRSRADLRVTAEFEVIAAGN